jgi:NAD(P)H-dependent flavin oxidoreductase YrpB (nitropropane dioxygenase family)
METRVTKLLGIEHPIVQGGMTARHSVNHQEFTW